MSNERTGAAVTPRVVVVKAGRRPIFEGEKAVMILQRVAEGETISSLSKEFGVTRNTIAATLKRVADAEGISLVSEVKEKAKA